MKRFLFLFLCVFMILPCFLSGSYFVFAEDTAIIENANDNRPLADAYASEEDPSAVYGNTDSLVLRSEKGKSTVVAMSYFSEALRTNNLLRLPAVTTPQRVDVMIADGVLIDEATFNYSEAETLLKDAVLVGRYMLGNSPVDIELADLMAEIEGEYFTVLLVAAPARTVEWSFDDFTTEDLLTGKSPSYNRCWSTEYNISVGGSGKTTADFVIHTDKNGDESGMFHVNGYKKRYKFYNTISDRDITAADIGRQFTVSFDIMCTTDSVATTGLKCAMDGDGVTTGPSAGGYHQNTYHTKTPITLSANVWQTVSFIVKIDQTIVDHQVGCVTIDFVGPDSEYRDYYVDNMSIVEVSPNVDGTENRFDAVEGDGKGLVLLSTVNRPLADAYASEEDSSAVYGNTDSLVLRSEKGKSTVVAMSYFSEALRTNNLLRLPAVTTPQRVDVIIVDGVLIDEATFNYSEAETLLKDAVLAGRYMLGNSPVDIDLTSFMAEIEGEYFTVLLVAAPARTVEWSFDDFTTEDLLTGKSPSYNRCWSTEYNISVGGGGKSKADFVVYADKDGNQSGMFHVNGYNRRYKFYNTISDRDITAEDIGRQFTVSFDIMCTTDSVANTGLKCAINGDGVTTGPSAGGYHMNTYHTKTPITLSANVWQTVSFTVEIDRTIVDHQVGCVTIDFVGPDSEYRDYYVDNMSIVEVSPNVDGTENRFDAVEGDGKGLALSSSFSSVISVTLDRSVTVLEAEISLSSPDAEASVTDVFRIFCSTADYTLLSMENHTGKLFFTMNGKTYYLCDGKGSLYTASKTLLKVVAFYDNTAGTVRFAVGDKLAYYTDGTEAAVTYGLSLVTGGHTGEATVAVFSQYDNASVSLAVDKITADKPIIVGTQTSVIGKDLRVLSGIETLYYSEIGFIVEREGKPSLNWKNDYIFTSVKALGETVTAQELGAEYLSAFILTGLDDAETGDSIHITPVAYVGSTAVKGETVSLIFTVENGSVSVATCSHPEQKEIDRKDPKPLADGSVTYQCSVCGCRETESIPATRSLKILAIGNSYSSDALSYFRNLIEACGLEDYITGHMFIGGCSLDDHWANAQSGEAAYSYWKHTPSEHFSSKANLETALTDEEWDVITIQQNSASSGIAADYSNIQNMIDYIQGHSLNSDAKILWHMTWAYQGDCTKNTFVEYFNSDQMTMYNSIVNAVTSKVLTQEEIADIIPSGTSIQNLRSSYLGDTLTRDGSHLSFDVGRYTAGLTLLVKLTGASIDELTWVPENYPLVERDLPAIKEAVKNAIATPFAVTQSTYLEADYETEEPEPDDSTETEIVAGSRLKLALTPTEGDTGLFLSFGQDVGEYVMLDWVPTYQSFWDSTLSMSITIGEDDTARKYIGSRLIEKNELPVGTVIVVDEGYQYCPEAWVDSTTRHTSDTRPIACAETVIIIDETWWGEYNYRAFNLSRAGGEVSPEDADHLRIYIPIDG